MLIESSYTHKQLVYYYLLCLLLLPELIIEIFHVEYQSIV